MVVGPYLRYDISSDVMADFYLLRYANDGRLLSPQTEQMLKDGLAGISDVFLFSHGWNNTFADAARSYRDFISGFMKQRADLGIPIRAGYKPLLIGVIWPSTSFLMPWEDGPQIAADTSIEAPRTEEMLRLLTASLDPGADARLAELVDGSTTLTATAAREAADIILDGLRPHNDPDDGSPAPTANELIDAWAALEGRSSETTDPDDFGGVGDTEIASEPAAASGFGVLDPRNLLRIGTVWLMKDRAGKVGAHGVGPLVRYILDNTSARLHLIGHSFGARVVLSSLAVGTPQVRAARSMLLLQPAVNRWCFADDVAGTRRQGGYHPILSRVELPVLSTFSKFDRPLRQAFHLAVRGSSLGEPEIAAVGDTVRYGALGGYGPAGLGGSAEEQPALAEGAGPYQFTPGKRVIAINGGVGLNGKPAINGHSDINNTTTWWLLHCLVNAT
jgi:hypothetical protein